MVTYEKSLKLIEEEEERQKNLRALEKGFQVANVFINKGYLDEFSRAEILDGKSKEICLPQKIRLYELSKVVFDPKEDVLDKLISVYNSLYNLSVTLAVIIKGSVTGVNFYFAVRSNEAAPLAGNVLESTLRGNFPGIEIRGLNSEETETALNNIGISDNGKEMTRGLATVSMVPSIRDKEKEREQFIQGLEKLINTLKGRDYLAVLLATPLGDEAITNRRHGLEEMYSTLTPHAKLSYAYGENDSHSVNRGVTRSFSKSVNESVTNSNSTSTSESSGTSYGSSSGSSFGGGASGDGASYNWGSNSGSSRSTSSSYTSGTSFSNSISNSVGNTETDGTNEGESDTKGTSQTKTITFENKGITDLLQKIEQQIARLNQGESYGLWESAAYFFSDEIATSVLAATTYKAVMTGEQSLVEQAHVNVWNGNRMQANNIRLIYEHVKYLVHPRAQITFTDEYNRQYVTPTSLVSGNELALLLGFPRKSVAGVAIQEMAEFGRAVVYENKKPQKTLSFGNIYHMGIEEKDTPVIMDTELFSSHCFITGSSGSGKSYATYNLLDKLLEQGIKMMVIEPAKGEYKQVFGNLNKVNIFTTDATTYRLLRINPFQFPEKIHVLSHIEQVLQIFSAAWPLYAAMPAILKEAVVNAYIKCGWDIQNSIWIEGICDHKYPVFADVLETLPDIINTSDYSAESKGNYKGALLTRVQAMTTGINGMIFRKSEGVSDEELFDENTLIDLSEVGSDETIALLMGVIIMRLNEHRKSQRKLGKVSSHDSKLKHITVLEEAHALLKRTSKDQNQEGANLVGKSVEMISNSIKEMRTYGEGFLIIDQSPLAVDSSAVENTATKIIMNTPSKDACEELGSALSLNEEQTKELSRLNVGVAAVMQKGWLSPVLMKVGLWNPEKYEAELQYENLSMMIFVRSCLVKELIKQIKENSYSALPLGKIIRNSNLESDRKQELMEIVDLFKNYRQQALKLSKENIGHLFLEIISCDALFNVIPASNIYNMSKFLAIGNKSPNEALSVIQKQKKYCSEWVHTLESVLNRYITITAEEKRCAVDYMLAYKTRIGEDGTKLSVIYGMLKDGDIRIVDDSVE